jgi:hypothetical protein
LVQAETTAIIKQNLKTLSKIYGYMETLIRVGIDKLLIRTEKEMKFNPSTSLTLHKS